MAAGEDGMDGWPQRARFRELLGEYQAKTGKNQLQAAADLGVARSSLRFWLYQRRRGPSLDVLRRASALFGCSVTEFIDDPGAAKLPGVADADWAGASEWDRLMAKSIFQDVTGDDLSMAEKEAVLKAYRAAKKMVVSLRGKPPRDDEA